MSNLKGVATIQLFDAETGELQQEVREENMITNAIENILNVPDYLATGLNTDGTMKSTNLRENVEPIYSQMLSGILIFDKNIKEDANITMPPFDCKEIGHAASVQGEQGSQFSREGTYNTVESGNIPNGYRHVWDFATDRANGDIACICLTSKSGGDVGVNPCRDYSAGGVTFSGKASYTSPSYQEIWYQTKITGLEGYSADYSAFYIDKKSNGDIRFLTKTLGGSRIYEVIINNPFKIGLFRQAARIKSVKVAYDTTDKIAPIYYDWRNDYSQYPGDTVEYQKAEELWNNTEKRFVAYHPYVYKNQIHIIYPQKTIAPYELRHIILSLDDYSVVQDKILPISFKPHLPLSRSYQSPNIYGYQYDTSGDKTYKAGVYFFDNHYFLCSSEPQLIAMNTDGSIYQKIGNYVNWKVYIDDEQEVCFGSGINYNYNGQHRTIDWLKKDKDTELYYIITTWVSYHTCGDATSVNHGCWIKSKDYKLPLYTSQEFYHSSYSSVDYVATAGVQSFYAYLGSINNLATPVRKQPGQTMKITYDITQV